MSSLATQSSLTDTPDGPKAQLRRFGVAPDVWVTQFYQGQIAGDASQTWFYGGKVDAFLKIDAEKLGLWPGFHVSAQYEHYFGDNINRRDNALLPVNTAQAYVNKQGYHSALSVSVTQDFGEHVSVSAGKFNMMTIASQTPLLGGGGIDTFMNRAFALPSTGVAYTAVRGGAADRVVVSAPYLIGGAVTFKTAPATLTLLVVDPRSAQNPQVIEHPFEKGLAVGGSVTIPTEIFGLRGFHTLRAAYSNARGIDLNDVPQERLLAAVGGPVITKKGYWFSSYALQQNLFQSRDKPSVGWGLFTLGTLSDGNPNPVKWSVLVGLAGNNLIEGRENDRWGVGFFHYGLTKPLLSALEALDVRRRSEGGVEAFYNLAITPWLRLSADLQLIDPWNPAKQRETYMALRLQTKL
ncbi:carbohydrate porin [Methylocystis iwaonis]|uniref:carbohydrate porin n=1 Tax=Methylocystis iwaonis TaxID=2885079 RepID=UPI002492CF8D|nr:carbohydrate porin [Methylocystis iwaonis]